MTFATTSLAKLVGMAFLAGTYTPPDQAASEGCRQWLYGTADMHELNAGSTLSSTGECGSLSSCHFQVFYSNRLPAEKVAAVTDRLEKTHALFYRTLSDAGFKLNALPEPLHCRFFDTRDEFDRYAWETEQQKLPWLDSYYSSRTNRVALLLESMTPDANRVGAPAIDTALVHRVIPDSGHHPSDFQMRIAHEAAHQLAFNSGLQTRGVMYPFWVAEGLAASFESESPRGPGTNNPVRSGHLLKAWRADKLRPFDDFLIMVEPVCRSRHELNDLYAQAWGVFHYLLTHHPRELETYLTRLAGSRVGRRSTPSRRSDVAAALPSMDELREGWYQYLHDLQNARQSEQHIEQNHEGPVVNLLTDSGQ